MEGFPRHAFSDSEASFRKHLRETAYRHGTFGVHVNAKLPPIEFVYETVRMDHYREYLKHKKRVTKEKQKETEARIETYVHSIISSSDDDDDDPTLNKGNVLVDDEQNNYDGSFTPVHKEPVDYGIFEGPRSKTPQLNDEYIREALHTPYVKGKKSAKPSTESDRPVTMSAELSQQMRAQSSTSFASSKDPFITALGRDTPSTTMRSTSRNNHRSPRRSKTSMSRNVTTASTNKRPTSSAEVVPPTSLEAEARAKKHQKKEHQRRIKQQEVFFQRLHNDSDVPNYKQIALQSSFNHKTRKKLNLGDTSEYWQDYERRYKMKVIQKKKEDGQSGAVEVVPKLLLVRNKFGGFEAMLEYEQENVPAQQQNNVPPSYEKQTSAPQQKASPERLLEKLEESFNKTKMVVEALPADETLTPPISTSKRKRKMKLNVSLEQEMKPSTPKRSPASPAKIQFTVSAPPEDVSILDISDYVLINYLLRFLRPCDIVFGFGLVCQRFNSLASSDDLWHDVYQWTWGSTTQFGRGGLSWKHAHFRRQEQHYAWKRKTSSSLIDAKVVKGYQIPSFKFCRNLICTAKRDKKAPNAKISVWNLKTGKPYVNLDHDGQAVSFIEIVPFSVYTKDAPRPASEASKRYRLEFLDNAIEGIWKKETNRDCCVITAYSGGNAMMPGKNMAMEEPKTALPTIVAPTLNTQKSMRGLIRQTSTIARNFAPSFSPAALPPGLAPDPSTIKVWFVDTENTDCRYTFEHSNHRLCAVTLPRHYTNYFYNDIPPSYWSHSDLVDRIPLMSADVVGTVKLWNFLEPYLPPEKQLWHEFSFNAKTSCAMFDESKVVAGCDTSIKIYDLHSGRIQQVFPNAHGSTILCLHFDGHSVVTGSRDRSVKLWDLRTKECYRTIVRENKEVHLLQCDRWKIVYAANDMMSFWDFRIERCQDSFQEVSSSPIPMAGKFITGFQFDDNKLILNTRANVLKMYNTQGAPEKPSHY